MQVGTNAYMKPSVVVLDLNGILADVRRKEAPPVVDRKPDVILPNGQKSYLNPGWKRFLKGVLMIPKVRVVLYTSRLKKNSEPIERLLMPELMCVTALMHGEDCLEPTSRTGNERFHPTKSVDKICEAVGCKPGDVVFIDDNPHRIILESRIHKGECAHVVKVETYDSLHPYPTDPAGSMPSPTVLDRAIFDLMDVLYRMNALESPMRR